VTSWTCLGCVFPWAVSGSTATNTTFLHVSISSPPHDVHSYSAVSPVQILALQDTPLLKWYLPLPVCWWPCHIDS
jgi:hypothetical protein